MPKRKTKKSAAKRFWKTASGKIAFMRAGRRHLLGGKARKRKRNLRKGATVCGADEKRMSLLLAT